tara:strand:- start:16 stop:432 length:417 start_codon:yes stop_codon:yes gene_type:complete
MEEYQILALFNSSLISNAIYFAAFVFLLWMAFRGVNRITDMGANVVQKVLSSLFSLSVVYFNLFVLGLLNNLQQTTAYNLAQLETISPGSQQLVDFFGGGAELPEFTLIPADPIAIIFFAVILISLLVPTWMAPEPKE